jgi:hypothetical protein
LCFAFAIRLPEGSNFIHTTSKVCLKPLREDAVAASVAAAEAVADVVVSAVAATAVVAVVDSAIAVVVVNVVAVGLTVAVEAVVDLGFSRTCLSAALLREAEVEVEAVDQDQDQQQHLSHLAFTCKFSLHLS